MSENLPVSGRSRSDTMLKKVYSITSLTAVVCIRLLCGTYLCIYKKKRDIAVPLCISATLQ